jgi:phage FluMu gp28-like protein
MNDMFKILCPFQIRWLRETAPLAMGEKSRRIGWTWMHALKVVLDRAERGIKQGGSHYYHSSADMTAAIEFIDYCGFWAGVLNAVASVTEEVEVIDDEQMTTRVLTFANGARIVAGSSNPKFFRSKGGEVGLDEFAFHRDGRELYKAAHATAMFWGYPLRAWSTHNGPGSYFNQLLGAIRSGAMKGAVHRVTIEDAVNDGIVERIIMRKKRLPDVPAPDPIARREWLDELRATCPDEDTWNEEYMCIPSSDQGSLLNYELIGACEAPNLELWTDVALGQRTLYAGFDVGRKRDLSVLWIVEKIGDVYWTRMVKVLYRMNFTAQEELLAGVLLHPSVKRLCIDATGIGAMMAERLGQRFGHRAEAVTFTSPVKSELAMPLLRAFQDRLLRIPAASDIREDLHKVRKVVTASGNIRFEADRDDAGHSDRFWALALAYHAADPKQGPVPAPMAHKPRGW